MEVPYLLYGQIVKNPNELKQYNVLEIQDSEHGLIDDNFKGKINLQNSGERVFTIPPQYYKIFSQLLPNLNEYDLHPGTKADRAVIDEYATGNVDKYQAYVASQDETKLDPRIFNNIKDTLEQDVATNNMNQVAEGFISAERETTYNVVYKKEKLTPTEIEAKLNLRNMLKSLQKEADRLEKIRTDSEADKIIEKMSEADYKKINKIRAQSIQEDDFAYAELA